MAFKLFEDKNQEAVTEKSTSSEDEILFKARKVFIFGEITDKLACAVCKKLLALSEDSNEPITIIISSPGGHVESGDAVHDMINFIEPKVTVIGTGWVGSAATHIFLGAEKENRICLPNTRFLIHQPAGGMGGQATDIAIQAKQIVRARERIAKVISEKTGQPYDKVTKDIDRDYWMDTDEALEYGIISKIITSKSEVN